MADTQPDSTPPASEPAKPRSFVAREWPYLLVLVVAFFGIAYTSFSNRPIMPYWIILAPFIGVICVVSRWDEAESREDRLRLIWTQALHWGAVLLAMYIMFVADVRGMMNADSRALATMTLLALGTFTAGVHVGAWRICLIGIILAISVPAIAWLDRSALLLVLVIVIVGAVVAPFFWRDRSASPHQR